MFLLILLAVVASLSPAAASEVPSLFLSNGNEQYYVGGLSPVPVIIPPSQSLLRNDIQFEYGVPAVSSQHELHSDQPAAVHAAQDQVPNAPLADPPRSEQQQAHSPVHQAPQIQTIPPAPISLQSHVYSLPLIHPVFYDLPQLVNSGPSPQNHKTADQATFIFGQVSHRYSNKKPQVLGELYDASRLQSPDAPTPNIETTPSTSPAGEVKPQMIEFSENSQSDTGYLRPILQNNPYLQNYFMTPVVKPVISSNEEVKLFSPITLEGTQPNMAENPSGTIAVDLASNPSPSSVPPFSGGLDVLSMSADNSTYRPMVDTVSPSSRPHNYTNNPYIGHLFTQKVNDQTVHVPNNGEEDQRQSVIPSTVPTDRIASEVPKFPPVGGPYPYHFSVALGAAYPINVGSANLQSNEESKLSLPTFPNVGGPYPPVLHAFVSSGGALGSPGHANNVLPPTANVPAQPGSYVSPLPLTSYSSAIPPIPSVYPSPDVSGQGPVDSHSPLALVQDHPFPAPAPLGDSMLFSNPRVNEPHPPAPAHRQTAPTTPPAEASPPLGYLSYNDPVFAHPGLTTSSSSQRPGEGTCDKQATSQDAMQYVDSYKAPEHPVFPEIPESVQESIEATRAPYPAEVKESLPEHRVIAFVK